MSHDRVGPTSQHLVDPDLVPFIELAIPRHYDLEMLDEHRVNSAAMLAAFVRTLELPDVDIVEHRITGDHGDLRVIAYRPTAPPTDGSGAPAVLWIHGGGYVGGTAEEIERRACLLTDRYGCVVFSVDYRLAPEFPFPAALRDCDSALRWIHGAAAGCAPSHLT